MVRSDSYTPGEHYRERVDCHNRVSGTGETCPKCGSELRTISVPRE